MGGGAHPLPESKSHSTPGVRLGYGKKTLSFNELEKRGGGGGTRGDRGAEAPVTEIIDGRQRAVMLAGAARPRVSRRARTVVRRRPSCAAVPEGLWRGPATARRRHVVCFASKHRVPFWNSRPCCTFSRLFKQSTR
jgi:hypothetical protein